VVEQTCDAGMRAFLVMEVSEPNEDGMAATFIVVSSYEIRTAVLRYGRSTSAAHSLLVFAVAILFVKTIIFPTLTHADGVGGTDCGGQGSLCKP
jgi:hypothetical protein